MSFKRSKENLFYSPFQTPSKNKNLGEESEDDYDRILSQISKLKDMILGLDKSMQLLKDDCSLWKFSFEYQLNDMKKHLEEVRQSTHIFVKISHVKPLVTIFQTSSQFRSLEGTIKGEEKFEYALQQQIIDREYHEFLKDAEKSIEKRFADGFIPIELNLNNKYVHSLLAEKYVIHGSVSDNLEMLTALYAKLEKLEKERNEILGILEFDEVVKKSLVLKSDHGKQYAGFLK